MRVRMLHVGLGGWGRDWARNVLQPATQVEMVGYVDPAPAALAFAQTTLGASANQCFHSLEEALATVEADAVLVTTRLEDHVPTALTALAARKHVLIEKPFAFTPAEAQTVVAVAAVQNRIVMVSQNYRFFPAVRAAAAFIREGTFGPIDRVSVEFRHDANQGVVAGNRHYTMPHPLLVDMAVHQFDMLRLVLGQEPRQVVCHAWNPPWSHFTEAAEATATILFNGGIVAQYQGSWVSAAPRTTWSGTWRIECEGGEICFASRNGVDLSGDYVTIQPRGGAVQELPLPKLAATGRAGVVAAFAEAIRTGTEPETSGRDNLGTLALMHAAVQSATTGMPQVVMPL